MKKLTALFLQQLSDSTRQAPALLARTRQDLTQEILRGLGTELSAQVLYTSPEGQEFQAAAGALRQRAGSITEPKQAIACLDELARLTQRKKQLHRQTQHEIGQTGQMRFPALHLFYKEEQERAGAAVEEIIRVDLFRILALGGAAMFERIPHFRSVPLTLPARIAYYKGSILPALESLSEKQKFGCWAVQYKAESRIGSCIKVPAYVFCEPTKSGAGLLPGESLNSDTSAGTLYQGMGWITNVTPATVFQAQEQGLQTRMRPGMPPPLEQRSPREYLDDHFAGRLYAMDPCEFFSRMAIAEIDRVMIRRGRLQQCLYCGSSLDRGAPVCQKCFKRVQFQ